MAQEPNGVCDISDLFDYYDKSRKGGSTPDIGQIVFTPVTHNDRKPPQIADAKRSDPHSHTKADIVIRSINDKVDFRGKPDRLPLYAMSLQQTEELLVVRAKKRPCVVLARTDGVNHKTLPAGQQGMALNAFGEAYLMAPIYSVSTAAKARSFGPVMTARVRCMMYPQFVYVPQSGLTIKDHGVIRLDRTFWSHLLGASEPQNLFLTTDTLGICWNQIRMLSGEAPDTNYIELRELLLAYLPTDLTDSTSNSKSPDSSNYAVDR